MKKPRFRIKIHFKNPKTRPIKATVEGTISAAEDEVRKTVGFPEDKGRDLRFLTVWGKRVVVASNEILYVELEEA